MGADENCIPKLILFMFQTADDYFYSEKIYKYILV